MTEEFPDLIPPEESNLESDRQGTSIMRVLLIIIIALIVICCCCFGVLAALYYGTEPFMELLGFPIPW